MKALLLSTAAAVLLLAVPSQAEEREFTATLVGHAILPAMTLIEPPADAPDFLAVSGRFTAPDRRRVEEIGSIPGRDGLRPTGYSLPFEGQPVQGFSGIRAMPDGTFWATSDNGFGNKANSADAALLIYNLAMDWEAGTVDLLETVFLSDPDSVVPFPIMLEGTERRYLTGADFDIESIQPVEDGFWIGDEFGPFLLKVDREGRVLAVFDTEIDGATIRSPDNPALSMPANPAAAMPAFDIKRSGGFEGLAMSHDGSHLYALLEGPVYVDGSVETTEDGAVALRIAEFSLADEAWTGRSWLYPLAEGGEAIGDFNMIDETRALVIERDNGAGTVAAACTDGPAADCFAVPSIVKRVYLIEMPEVADGAAIRKIGYIDLMNIADPDGVRRQGGGEGFYDMPFVTIENVDMIDDRHIIVGNDNNLPFSAGRALDKADDNEFVLLEVGDFLSAR